MPKRHYDDWLSAYLRYSSSSESPDKFHFWTGVSTIAGALRRRVFITKATYWFDWVPNFYIVFVAPPGIVSKTTTANIGMDLLRDVPGVHFGPGAITWQALISKFEDCRTTVEWPDGTTSVMSPMTIVSSELGNLLNFEDKQMVDHFVNLWDCHKTFEKSTKTNGNDILEYPWINILGCTTPAWIADNVPDYMIGGGFTSRCIFVYGERKRKLVAYPGYEMNVLTKEMRPKLVEDLVQISNLLGECELAPCARKWGAAWYEEHNIAPTDPDAAVAGYMARKQTHLHKLAMVLAVSRSDNLIITADLLTQARGILEAAEGDMPKVFAHVGMSVETRATEQLIQLVKRANGTQVQKHIAYRAFSRYLTATQFNEVVASAAATGRMRVFGTNNGTTFAPGPGA